MKTDLQTTQASTALLCNASAVDAQETKSLCCAAAGITASISATAEALIPHEKLRGAATPDATLNAQDRPPAQPVEGYTRCTELRKCSTVMAECLIDRIQNERISINWEYEGGCHVELYYGEVEPVKRAYGDSIADALEKLNENTYHEERHTL